jgi:hypothetical protein
MADLIAILKSFNRKERFHLVGQALGNPEFKLSEPFRTDLGTTLRLSIPPDAFVAMDYHLDWLYGSIAVACDIEGPHENSREIIKGNQQDIDLLVVYREHEVIHVILLEAKGEGAWTSNQISPKAARIEKIFDENEWWWKKLNIHPHFVACSPDNTFRLSVKEWPGWMKAEDDKVAWLKLQWPANQVQVFRCDATGRQDQAGRSWNTKASRLSKGPKPHNGLDLLASHPLLYQFVQYVEAHASNQLSWRANSGSITFTSLHGNKASHVGLVPIRGAAQLYRSTQDRPQPLLLSSRADFPEGLTWIRVQLRLDAGSR